MSLYNSLYIGASGLTAFGQAMQVIGNNVGNVNTIGFKTHDVLFSDVLSQTTNITQANLQNQTGKGVKMGRIARDESQGNKITTTSPTNLAINGNGFFVIKQPGTGSQFYTRAGDFLMDSQYNLVNSQGYNAQGWALDAQGNVTGNLQNINLNNLASQAQATGKVDMALSLDSAAPVIPAATVFNPLDNATYSSKTEMNVYDSLGQSHAVTVYFTKTAANSWNWQAVANGAELTGGVAGTPTAVGGGSLSFGPGGELQVETAPTTTFNWAGGAAPGAINFNFGNAVTTDAQGVTGTGLDGTVQLAGGFSTRGINIDGYAAGSLDKLEVDAQGRIYGVFTNGQRRSVYQIALANFPNTGGMVEAGNNMLQQSIASGTPFIDVPTKGGLGNISPYELEQSNVDIANEFVKMIQVQRSYEANSKTVMTTDQMLTALMAIKR